MFSFWNELSNTQKLDFLRQIISTISIVIDCTLRTIYLAKEQKGK